MSDRFAVSLVQLNVETEELGCAFSPDSTGVLTAVDRSVVAAALEDHVVEEARAHGWDFLRNGELLDAAEAPFFKYLAPSESADEEW